VRFVFFESKIMQFNFTDFKACIRAFGAILLANSVVVPVLTDFNNRYWWALFVSGLLLGISTSINFKPKQENSK
jgi:hypothetical protein